MPAKASASSSGGLTPPARRASSSVGLPYKLGNGNWNVGGAGTKGVPPYLLTCKCGKLAHGLPQRVVDILVKSGEFEEHLQRGSCAPEAPTAAASTAAAESHGKPTQQEQQERKTQPQMTPQQLQQQQWQQQQQQQQQQQGRLPPPELQSQPRRKAAQPPPLQSNFSPPQEHHAPPAAATSPLYTSPYYEASPSARAANEARRRSHARTHAGPSPQMASPQLSDLSSFAASPPPPSQPFSPNRSVISVTPSDPAVRQRAATHVRYHKDPGDVSSPLIVDPNDSTQSPVSFRGYDYVRPSRMRFDAHEYYRAPSRHQHETSGIV
eukprot:Rhum_TRINITY_DN10973_c0_g1::Rhum_TRINITY_DN10973_c0_g1_i1::g.41122::m.41122